VLVLVGAALSVAPPLLTQQAFDKGLFPDQGQSLPNVPVLLVLVGVMVALWIASSALGVWQTFLTAEGGQQRHGCPPHPTVLPPAGDGARLLHQDQDRRHPESPADDVGGVAGY